MRTSTTQSRITARAGFRAGDTDMHVVHRQIWEKPVAESADNILDLTELDEEDAIEVTEGITNPDVPRICRIVGSAAGISGDVVIEGTNVRGEPITDTIAANGDTPVDGVKAFRTITKITLPPRSQEGDKISVGGGKKLGMDRLLPSASGKVLDTVMAATADGVYETTRPTLTKHASEVERTTVQFDTALDGSTSFALYWITEDI